MDKEIDERDSASTDDSASQVERRRFMKTVSAASIGGTVGTGFVSAGDLPSLEDSSLDTRGTGDYRSHFTVQPVVLHETELTTDRRSFVNEVIDTGTVSTYGHVPIPAGPEAALPGDRYVESRGDYYRLSVEERGRAEVKKHTLRAETVDAEPTGSSVDVSALPERERKAVERVVRLERESSHRELSEEYRTVVFSSGPPVESLRGSDRKLVTSEGDIFRLVIERKDVPLVHYATGAELVGSRRDALESEVGSEFAGTVFRTADWSEGEASIFAEALEDGPYTEWSPYSSGYESLLVRFGSPLSATHRSKSHSVTIDGRYYRVNIDVAHIDTPSV